MLFKQFFKKRRKARKTKPLDYDYLPLFFWDKNLSPTAKIFMSLIAGGKNNREKTIAKLHQVFQKDTVDSISEALQQLESLGYITTDPYVGEYGEPRVDHRICICPDIRLPKITEPSGGPVMPARYATEIYDNARKLGFIAETGKGTTYLLYDALRIFTVLENVLDDSETIILPIIGLERRREGAEEQSFLHHYPHSISVAAITNTRILFVQEACSSEGRQEGIARLIDKKHSDIKEVILDEKIGRITFKGWNEADIWENTYHIDLISIFALEHFAEYYISAKEHLPRQTSLPVLSYMHEEFI